MRELKWVRIGLWFTHIHLICCLSCSSADVFFISTRSDLLSLSASLRRISRCSSTIRELVLGTVWILVCSYASFLQSNMFKCEWLCYMPCICIGVTKCRCQTQAYKGYPAAVATTIKELDMGKARLMVCSYVSLLSLSSSNVNNCATCTRSD